jgi:CheY-like chemotaxis protein
MRLASVRILLVDDHDVVRKGLAFILSSQSGWEVWGEASNLQPGNAAQHIVASSGRIRAELRYKELIDIDEAIRRTIAWEQDNPPSTINPQQFDYDAEDAALTSQA